MSSPIPSSGRSDPHVAAASTSGRVPPLLSGAAAVAAALASLLVVATAIDRWPLAWDTAIMATLRDIRGLRWLARAAVDLTALGGGTVLTLAVMAVSGLLLVMRRWPTALVLIAACASGGQVVDMVKVAVGRARPDIAGRMVPVTSASFPSAHAANSAVVYLTIAALAGAMLRGAGARRYVMACAILLVGAIGCSRVYLGVHWPSDVAAGWAFGTFWAVGWWWASASLRVLPRQR